MILPGLAAQKTDLAGSGAPRREDATGEGSEPRVYLEFDECPSLAHVLGIGLSDLLDSIEGNAVGFRAA